jgi:hypothetical protein
MTENLGFVVGVPELAEDAAPLLESIIAVNFSSLSESTDEFRNERNLLSNNAVTVAVREDDPEKKELILNLKVDAKKYHQTYQSS